VDHRYHIITAALGYQLLAAVQQTLKLAYKCLVSAAILHSSRDNANIEAVSQRHVYQTVLQLVLIECGPT